MSCIILVFRCILWCGMLVVSLNRCRGQLAWDNQSIHITAAPMDKVLAGKFVYKNSGQSEMRIRPASDCGCLTVIATKEIMLPGDHGDLTASFVVGDRIGKFRQVIKVETDDSGKFDELVFEAEIPALAEYSPSKLLWTKGEQPSSKEVSFKVIKGAPIKLVRAYSHDPRITASLTPDAQTGGYLLKVEPKTDAHSVRTLVQVYSEWTGLERSPLPSPKPPPIFSIYVWVD